MLLLSFILECCTVFVCYNNSLSWLRSQATAEKMLCTGSIHKIPSRYSASFSSWQPDHEFPLAILACLNCQCIWSWIPQISVRLLPSFFHSCHLFILLCFLLQELDLPFYVVDAKCFNADQLCVQHSAVYKSQTVYIYIQKIQTLHKQKITLTLATVYLINQTRG